MLKRISTTFDCTAEQLWDEISTEWEANLIESKKSVALSPIWNHTIWFHSLEESRLHYTDETEIQAKLLTGVIWAFAYLFYRHRQRPWKVLLHRKTQGVK